MKCMRCNSEMVNLKKFRLVNAFVETEHLTLSGSLYRKNLVLYAEKDSKGIRGCVGEGRETYIIVPSVYICEKCGHLEYTITLENIEKIKEIELNGNFHDTSIYLKDGE